MLEDKHAHTMMRELMHLLTSVIIFLTLIQNDKLLSYEQMLQNSHY
jgi:hypothetical protein